MLGNGAAAGKRAGTTRRDRNANRSAREAAHPVQVVLARRRGSAVIRLSRATRSANAAMTIGMNCCQLALPLIVVTDAGRSESRGPDQSMRWPFAYVWVTGHDTSAADFGLTPMNGNSTKRSGGSDPVQTARRARPVLSKL